MHILVKNVEQVLICKFSCFMILKNYMHKLCKHYAYPDFYALKKNVKFAKIMHIKILELLKMWLSYANDTKRIYFLYKFFASLFRS